MKNFTPLSRNELQTIVGGEGNCHCSPSGTGLPPKSFDSDSPQDCWNICACYRNEPKCKKDTETSDPETPGGGA